jgi:site-specific DNA-methyltransferase (adenine-specific)
LRLTTRAPDFKERENLELSDIKAAIKQKPYHEEAAGVIYCADCLDILPQIPDKAIDLIYADPPFNAINGIGIYSKEYSGFNDKLSIEDYQKFCGSWFRAASAVCPKLLITPGIANMFYYPQPLWSIVIYKPSRPSFNRFGGYNCWEPILTYGKPVKRIPRDVIDFDSLNFVFKNINHPCPDNINLVRWVIDTWSSPDNIVIDPFLGSGSLAVAAKQLGRKFIGIEISQKYCDIAVQRLQQGILI